MDFDRFLYTRRLFLIVLMLLVAGYADSPCRESKPSPVSGVSGMEKQQPLTEHSACRQIYQLALVLPGTLIDRYEGTFHDECTRSDLTGCMLIISGSWRDLAGRSSPGDSIFEFLSTRGWEQELRYSADGPDGTFFALSKDGIRCFVRGQWDGGDITDDTYVPGDAYQFVVCCARFDGDGHAEAAVRGRVKAVSIDHIKNYGVVTAGADSLDEGAMVALYGNPEEGVIVDSIRVLAIVEFDRLSEIRKIPYWAPRPECRLPGGEWFRIESPGRKTWLPADNLMTFSSTWRQNNLDDFIYIYRHRLVFCLYSSGQGESAGSSVLTVWERDRYENVWILLDYVYDPAGRGLYMIPRIEEVVADEGEPPTVKIGASGSDAGDVWGEEMWYRFEDGKLVFVKNEPVNEEGN